MFTMVAEASEWTKKATLKDETHKTRESSSSCSILVFIPHCYNLQVWVFVCVYAPHQKLTGIMSYGKNKVAFKQSSSPCCCSHSLFYICNDVLNLVVNSRQMKRNGMIVSVFVKRITTKFPIDTQRESTFTHNIHEKRTYTISSLPSDDGWGWGALMSVWGWHERMNMGIFGFSFCSFALCLLSRKLAYI